MAQFIEGQLVCGAIRKDGTPCMRKVQGTQFCCFHKETRGRKKKNFEDLKDELVVPLDSIRRGKYSGVLPSRLQLHYNDDDPELLNMRHRIAILDAFLKDELNKLKDTSGFGLDQMRQVLLDLAPFAVDSKPQQMIEDALKTIREHKHNYAIQANARKLISEIGEQVKNETNRLVAIGGALTLAQVGTIVNMICLRALVHIERWAGQTTDEQGVLDAKRDFIREVKTNIIDTNHMILPTQLPVNRTPAPDEDVLEC